MMYEWDPAKAAANLAKHGVDFRDAIRALRDPNRIEEIDDRFDYGEERLRTIGMAFGSVLFVITTVRGIDTCRLISARRADRHERNRYCARDD